MQAHALQSARTGVHPISRVREPHDQRAETGPERTQPEPALLGSGQTPDTGIEAKPLPVLAVRTGPAPLESVESRVEERLRAELSQRARVTRVSELLATRETRTEENPAIELLGEGRGQDQVPLFGQDAAQESPTTRAASSPAHAGRLVTIGQPQALREDGRRAELQADHRVGQRQAANREVTRESGERASEVLPHTGAVQSDDPRPALEEEPKERVESKVAERAFTQAGIVEAERHDAIVSRFLQGLPSVQTGPEPHADEHLGERSVPLSTFA
ncbi:MAG: hypothetical protein ACE5FG_10720 [Myxococcota bacterium]